MGNMGNPVSTRLGINQFWYRHWYSDTTRQLNLKQDRAFESLIALYLQHGLTFQTNPFVHEYWYNHRVKTRRIDTQAKLNTRFFRRFFYTNDTLAIEHSYLIRHATPEYFPMRIWVFKYVGWVIISVQWFKPLKTKESRTTGGRSNLYVGGLATSSPDRRLLNRLKLVTLLLLQRSKNKYSF